MMRPSAKIAVLAASLTACCSASADWPQWRGPNANGFSPAKGVPTELTAGDVLWKFPLPGRSGATPALAGDRFFVSTPDGEDLYLFCISTEGKELWKRKLGTGNKQKGFNGKNNSASPSPATDGEKVWILIGSGELYCFSKDGDKIWERKLTEDYGPFTQDFGVGCTPLVWKDMVVFPCIHRGATSYLLALNKNDGKTLWKVDRVTEAVQESRDAYCSPAIWEGKNGEAAIIMAAADDVTASDPKTGAELWRFHGLNPENNPTYRVVVTPVATPDLILACSCKQGPLFGIRPGGKGDVTQSHLEWKRDTRNPDVSSPAVHEGLVYLIRNGEAACIELESGKEVWSKRFGVGAFFASPVVADGKVYTVSEAGKAHVLAAGREFKLLSSSDLGDPVFSTPIPADGKIYFRTFKALVCYGKK